MRCECKLLLSLLLVLVLFLPLDHTYANPTSLSEEEDFQGFMYLGGKQQLVCDERGDVYRLVSTKIFV